MSYKINDTVLYGTQGVCQITEIVTKCFDGTKIEYYVLKPIYDEMSTIFVPIHNQELTSKIRRMLSAEEISVLIQTMPDQESIWIENEMARRDRYKAIIAEGDRGQLVKLIKTLYQHQQALTENGKKLHVSDERFFKEAERILYEEFAHVLKIQREQVLPFIMDQIQVEEKSPAARAVSE